MYIQNSLLQPRYEARFRGHICVLANLAMKARHTAHAQPRAINIGYRMPVHEVLVHAREFLRESSAHRLVRRRKARPVEPVNVDGESDELPIVLTVVFAGYG